MADQHSSGTHQHSGQQHSGGSQQHFGGGEHQSGSTQHRCAKCNQSFNSAEDLRRHEEQHHGQGSESRH